MKLKDILIYWKSYLGHLQLIILVLKLHYFSVVSALKEIILQL